MSRVPSSLDRFSDPLTPMNYSGPPTSLPMLLSRLKMKGKPKSVQRAAVEEWLKDNKPLVGLAVGLELEYGIIV
ncbi:hypothetical protein GC425_04605 [Corynebacterium sp. zg254]|nr:hypothetical protein [Corynebacterium sp. zg254]